MMPAESGWPALKSVVADALELPADARDAHLDAECPNPAQRAEALRLLRACEQAAASPVLDLPAAEFVAPVLAEVHEREREMPEALRTALAGRYTVERELGRGGMATVYLARDERHGRAVALKLLRPELVPDDGPWRGAARFQREIEIAARLSHPHILPLYDSGAAGGLLYYITPYVDGETLRERLRRDGRVPLPESLRLLRDVARALAYAHRQGLVHRDIKPANILLNQEGDALVADFGVAKALAAAQGPAEAPEAELRDGALVLEGSATTLSPELTDVGLVLGTPAYMAPEQLRGQAADPRSDVWALGVVLYEMAAGEQPFQGQNGAELITAILSHSLRPLLPPVPAELRAVVERCLHKEPGQRYQSAGEVCAALEAIASGTAPKQGHAPHWSVPRAARRALQLVVGVALVATVGLLSFNSRGLWQRLSGATTPRIESITVLPFRSASPGSGDPLLELGLAETLITRLSANSSLRVRSLASAQRFAGPQRDAIDAIDAGRQLGAAYVVEGSIQRHGDGVRVNARLLTVSDGTTVWADTFDETIERVFTLQDGIARAVTAALALEAPATPVRGRSPCEGADAEAYRALLTGRYLNMRPSVAQLTDAVASFRRAIDLDPSCARAYAGLSWAHRAQMIAGDSDPREFAPLARSAAERAIAIDPGSAEAHASRGFIEFWLDWNWTAAETSFSRAIALDPSSADAHYGYAHLLVNLARFDEGLDHLRQARELDPLSPLINTLEAGFLSAANRPDSARQVLERVLGLEPDFWVALYVRGGLALDRDDPRSAIGDLGRAAEGSGQTSLVLAVLVTAHAAAGDSAAARAILEQLESRDRAGYVRATSLAAGRLGLGDTEGALDLLERGYRERDSRMAFLKIDARWNGLRAHPRFRELSRTLGLEADRAYGRY